MEAGRKQLAAWRAWFEKRMLPQTHYDKKRFSHPFDWLWSKDPFPCKWCDYGQICREDHRVAVDKGNAIALDESYGISYAQERRAEYSLDLVRQAVFARWGSDASAYERG
jgi:hypothetical protein